MNMKHFVGTEFENHESTVLLRFMAIVCVLK